MAWEQTLAWTLMTIIGIWGAGTLLSFAVNRMQIISVAEQAHALVEHPSVSDYQLTALHTLRNDAGRLQHRIQEERPGISASVWTITSSCSTRCCPGTAWRTTA
jgi:type VI secretion system protein ImpL